MWGGLRSIHLFIHFLWSQPHSLSKKFDLFYKPTLIFGFNTTLHLLSLTTPHPVPSCTSFSSVYTVPGWLKPKPLAPWLLDPGRVPPVESPQEFGQWSLFPLFFPVWPWCSGRSFIPPEWQFLLLRGFSSHCSLGPMGHDSFLLRLPISYLYR